jgi:hypothetical protein
VDKRERIDGPSRFVFDFGLISAEHPMAGLVHLEDDNAGWANIGLDRTQGSSEGGDCWKASGFENCQ